MPAGRQIGPYTSVPSGGDEPVTGTGRGRRPWSRTLITVLVCGVVAACAAPLPVRGPAPNQQAAVGSTSPAGDGCPAVPSPAGLVEPTAAC